jgi:hypothetical protein
VVYIQPIFSLCPSVFLISPELWTLLLIKKLNNFALVEDTFKQFLVKSVKKLTSFVLVTVGNIAARAQ